MRSFFKSSPNVCSESHILLDKDEMNFRKGLLEGLAAGNHAYPELSLVAQSDRSRDESSANRSRPVKLIFRELQDISMSTPSRIPMRVMYLCAEKF